MHWLTASPTPLVVATGLYLLQAWAYWQTGQKGMAVAFLGYAAANVGLVMGWSPRG